jgi:hypothetical protein
MNKKIIIAMASGFSVVIIGVVLYFGNFFFNDPRAVLLRAAANTWNEVKSPEYTLPQLYASLTSAPWRQDISFGIHKPGGTLLPDIDPRLLSVLELLTIKHTARVDKPGNQRVDHIAAQLAVTTLADLEIQSSLNELAFSIPFLFDYYLTLNPRRVAKEWDESLLGSYMGSIDGIILEEPFYEYYRQILFPEKTYERPDFVRHIALLNEGTEYSYLGGDIYEIRVLRDSANIFWQTLDIAKGLDFPGDLIGDAVNGFIKTAKGLSFDADVTLTVQLERNKIHRITLETVVNGQTVKIDIALNGHPNKLDSVVSLLLIDDFTVFMNLDSNVGNPGILKSEMYFHTVNMEIRWDIHWDKEKTAGDNFSFQASASDERIFSLDLRAGGLLKADKNNGYIDANIKNAGLSMDFPSGSLEASLNGWYMLRTDNEAIVFDGNRKPVTSFNELDLLLVFGRLVTHPQLGDIIGGFLPF